MQVHEKDTVCLCVSVCGSVKCNALPTSAFLTNTVNYLQLCKHPCITPVKNSNMMRNYVISNKVFSYVLCSCYCHDPSIRTSIRDSTLGTHSLLFAVLLFDVLTKKTFRSDLLNEMWKQCNSFIEPKLQVVKKLLFRSL